MLEMEQNFNIYTRKPFAVHLKVKKIPVHL